MPGLYRLVVFASIQHVYSLTELGRAACEMSLAQLAGFFTAIGWASLILVRVPMAADRRSAIDAFYTVVWMAGATTVAVNCAAFAVSAVAPVDFDIRSFVLLLCGWSTYQLARHYFVANRSYRTAVIFDISLIGCSQALLYFCRHWEGSSSFALALALLIISLLMFATIGAPSRASFGHRFDAKGLQFGMTNFLSGGINLIFVPVASLTCGVAFAGGFSLLSSITAVAILLPRAISTTQLPELAKLVASRSAIDEAYQKMRRVVLKSNVVVFGLNALFVVVAVFCGARGIDVDHRAALVAAGLLLAAQYTVAMGSAVPSSVMMVFEQATQTAGVNLQTTAVFAVCCGILAVIGGQLAFMGVLVAAIVASALRNVLIERHARRTIESYAHRNRAIPQANFSFSHETGPSDQRA
jgi:hypothetical protein